MNESMIWLKHTNPNRKIWNDGLKKLWEKSQDLVLEAVAMLPFLSQCKKGYLGANMAFLRASSRWSDLRIKLPIMLLNVSGLEFSY